MESITSVEARIFKPFLALTDEKTAARRSADFAKEAFVPAISSGCRWSEQGGALGVTLLETCFVGNDRVASFFDGLVRSHSGSAFFS